MKLQYFSIWATMQLYKVIYAAILLFLIISSPLFAQVNLVPNTSFKIYNALPVANDISPTNAIGEHWIVRLNDPAYSPMYFVDPAHVTNWFRANQATVDYYHAKAGKPINGIGSNAGVRVPQNWGQEHDLWGASGILDSAYAGISIVRYNDLIAGIPIGSRDYKEYRVSASKFLWRISRVQKPYKGEISIENTSNHSN